MIKTRNRINYRSRFVGLFVLGLLFSCQSGQKEPQVVFDTTFKGARLDSIKAIGNLQFTAMVLPENEPINKSPWFAFAVQSKENQSIQLTLKYGEYQHRYIPKISTDKKTWQPLAAANINIDTLSHTATLQLAVSPQKLYVAAQELETAEDTYTWMRNVVGKQQHTVVEVAGKTAQENANYALIHESPEAQNAIVLVARQHPPESPGGTIGFKSFYETLFADTDLAQHFRAAFNIYTFPLLNPDGADLGNWRHNANGVDLNRDWVAFSQPETKMVRDFVNNKVKNGKKVRFALDFHTSYSGPYLLVLDSINEARTNKIIPQWVQNINSQSAEKVETRRRSQELPYCYNFFYNTYGAEAVTYEDGDEIDRETIRTRARLYATELMKVLLDTSEKNKWNE